MCLLVLARNFFPAFPLALAFNRDEYFSRPTRPAHWWDDMPWILGGRDAERGGTWLGVTRSGRLCLLSFVRNGDSRVSPRSRGQLVAEFLRRPCDPEEYFARLHEDREGFLGYNIIAGDLGGELFHYSNITSTVTKIPDGVAGMSNAAFDTPWPKVERAKEAVRALGGGPETAAELFRIMSDRERAPAELLPSTGVSPEWESALSPAFIFAPEAGYGTRSTTVILRQAGGRAELIERTHPFGELRGGEERFIWTPE
jgi:uncharacterized protein with NRDE domain